MNTEQTLSKIFTRFAKDALSQHPQIKHSWSINDELKDQCKLEIPKQNDKGFDILVNVSLHEIRVFAKGIDFVHFSIVDNFEEAVIDLLGLIRDLLSPHMRIRELRAGNSAYRWYMESFRNRKWIVEQTTGLLFWNFFGKRSEKIYQNSTLEGRLNQV